MAHFKVNDIVPFHDKRNTVLKMEQLIGSGAQADVYKAYDILNRQYVAAKHCYGAYASNKGLFYKKVQALSQHPAPHPALCWPIALSPLTKNASFLYIMPLLDGYRPVTGVINRTDKLTELQKAQLLMKLAEALDALHSRKFVYGDISAQNILYRIDADGSVDVRLIDCENVSLPGFSFGLQGSGRFRAPELLLPDPSREDGGPQPPSVYSDAYAFQVLAFRVLLRRHPLDGALSRTVPMDDHEGFLRYYARAPLFIFEGTKNDPGPRVTANWEALPQPMQLFFRYCFSQKALHHKEERLGMKEFMLILKKSYPL